VLWGIRAWVSRNGSTDARERANDFNRIADGLRCPQRKAFVDCSKLQLASQLVTTFCTYPEPRPTWLGAAECPLQGSADRTIHDRKGSVADVLGPFRDGLRHTASDLLTIGAFLVIAPDALRFVWPDDWTNCHGGAEGLDPDVMPIPGDSRLRPACHDEAGCRGIAVVGACADGKGGSDPGRHLSR
jgi:hypothetical protein